MKNQPRARLPIPVNRQTVHVARTGPNIELLFPQDLIASDTWCDLQLSNGSGIPAPFRIYLNNSVAEPPAPNGTVGLSGTGKHGALGLRINLVPCSTQEFL